MSNDRYKSVIFAVLAVAAFGFAVSCATAPKAAQTPAPAAPVAQASPTPQPAAGEAQVPAPDALRTKASDLRKKAFDYGLKDVLAEDYATAEGAFTQGNAAYGKDNAASAAAFTDAATRFQDLITRGLPLLAASEEKRAEGLRDTAVGKHAGDAFPALFAYAESRLAAPRDAQAKGDFDSAITGYRASAKDYEVLYKLCDAKTAREAIVARDFAKWDPSNWSIAENRFQAAQDLLATDASGAASSADEAILRYGIASRTALEYYAGDRKKNTETERDRASAIKADVAVKDEYAAALAFYSQAETAQQAKDFDSSSSLYDRAAAGFDSAYKDAKAKMDVAKGELDSLDSAISKTESVAGTTR